MNSTVAAPEIERTLRLLEGLFVRATLKNVAFKLWDDTRWPDHEPRAATIVLKHPDVPAPKKGSVAGGTTSTPAVARETPVIPALFD